MATLPNGLKTIENGATIWFEIFNDNMAKLSPIRYGLDSAKGTASSYSYQFYYATDTYTMYYSNASAWIIVSSARPQIFPHAGSEGVNFSITVGDSQTYRRVNIIRTSDGMDITGGVTYFLTANTITVNLGDTDFAVMVLYEKY